MKHSQLTYQIRGEVFKIYNKLGPAWKENTYEEFLACNLKKANLNVERQKQMTLYYKGKKVGLFRPDIIVENKIILELKAVPEIIPLHKAQTINYLKASNLDLALLINFGGSSATVNAFPNYFNDFRNIENKKIKTYNNSEIQLNNKDNLIYPELSEKILAIAYEIHRCFGPGFFHRIYRRSFWEEMRRQGIDFKFEKQARIILENKIVEEMDIYVFNIENKILLSTVASNRIDDQLKLKIKFLLKYFNLPLGLIINFSNLNLDYYFIKPKIPNP